MKQTKKKSDKKQPINVQLTKDDMVELLAVVRGFMSEELSARNKRIFLNQSEMHSRIISLEGKERRRESKELKQIPSCPHDDRLSSIVYISPLTSFDSPCFYLVYKCKWCKNETRKYRADLSRREKKALKILGVQK